MAVMVWMIPEIDDEIRMRAVKMALAHDMGEAIVGDITPSDGVPRDEKLLKERLALAYLACLIRPVNPSFADEIEELWSEFEAGDSKTAQLVRSVDALECMHQAVVYEERSQLVKDLGEFMELETKVSASELRDWAKCLKQERDTLWSSKVTQDLTFLFILGGPGVGKGTQCARITQDTSSVHISVGDLLREETKSTSSGFADFIKDSIRNSVIIPADFSIRGRFFTILLKCSEEVQLYRLNRRSESSGRIDDNDDSIKKRLRTFSQENLKIEKHLQSKGPFWTIDANGSVDDVYTSIKVVVDEITKDASQ
ncbi:hypothetical protein H2204_015411 [Knufia peltigerae]|uniref:HD domain-containing protein n=1 Tax=Knufia peltigerae TaxID=1002370 RepID=A0AA39CJ59_9EURO|nr:hypothetical protein H2204_015411 [Knufia peltigerae]